MVKRASLFIGGTGGSDAASARAGLQVDASNDVTFANVIVSGNVDVGSGLLQTDDGLRTVTLANTIITGNVNFGSGLFQTNDADTIVTVTGNNVVTGNVDFGSGLFQTNDADTITTVTGNSVFTGNTVIGSPTAGSGADGSINAQDVQIGGVTVVQIGVVQSYTRQQTFGTATLTDAATIEWNLTSNQVARVKLTANRILDNANSQVNGGMYTLQFEQDNNGSHTLTFGTDYKFPGGTAPTLTTTNNAIDVMTCHSNGTSMFCVVQADFK